ncbi:transglutaminase-like cysteine peptidase [Pseudaminobacter sp. 19-2017]|uniref:Transglutaminase-like cysteine peptidase n=1 Tax=Pseudaminobacter soli (ex Zhang et al. 2022) TaxID=2831468 RepID=A0A942E0Z7_9HYPH|nr:transglutaminase-like cysteine peptidase [Pseudaminobacter soli]MBS3648895.1 transglutaminase-like cysteine peptidase [Pseudaminobacter soli]
MESALAAIALYAMSIGGQTSIPYGHYDFCRRVPAECGPMQPAAPIDLTKKLFQRIEQINIGVNLRVSPRTDHETYGQEEFWTYPVQNVGDCEDIVLEKRKALSRLVPLSNLLITVVRKPDGEGHAVLTMRTSEGDLILDNLTNEIKRWSESNYTFLKRQDASHAGRWVAITN